MMYNPDLQRRKGVATPLGTRDGTSGPTQQSHVFAILILYLKMHLVDK